MVDGPLPQARLRRQHERGVFHQIRGSAPISRAQLAERSGLSAQAVGSIVRSFLESGLIRETAIQRRVGPGAPAIGLEVEPGGAFAFGFGLERDSLSGVVLDLGGTVRWQDSAILPPGEPPKTTLGRVEGWVTSVLDDPVWARQRHRFCGVGIVAPGPLDVTTGIIGAPPNFATWRDVGLIDALRPAIGLPVVVDNAATAAAIGVQWRLPRTHASFLYCYWGLGVGGGLVLDDDVYRGTTGNAIEIGHMVADPFGRPCACGAIGCLEAEASVGALLQDARACGSFATIEELVAAAPSSTVVTSLLNRAAERMGAVLLSALNMADVDQVVIGGEHFHAVENIFLPIIKTWVEDRAFRRSLRDTRVTVTTLGEEANAIGAAAATFRALVPGGSRMPLSCV